MYLNCDISQLFYVYVNIKKQKVHLIIICFYIVIPLN